MSFAGVTDSTNYTHYLINNYVRNDYILWWSLSPKFRVVDVDGYDQMIYIEPNGFFSYISVDSTLNSRPAVTLLSSTQITGGNGTVSNPYTIN